MLVVIAAAGSVTASWDAAVVIFGSGVVVLADCTAAFSAAFIFSEGDGVVQEGTLVVVFAVDARFVVTPTAVALTVVDG